MCPVDSTLFGRPSCAQILVTLACRGPKTVREIARAIGREYRGTYDTVEKFLSAGILHKSVRPGSRKRVSLDRALPAYAELRDLLVRIGAHFGVEVELVNRARCGSVPVTKDQRRPVDLQALFGPQNRGMLLLLAAARSDVDREDVRELLSISICGAEKAIRWLEAEGALRAGAREGLRRPVVLDPGYFAHDELVALLDRLLHLAPEYRTLASDSRRQVGGWSRSGIHPIGPQTRARSPKRAVRAIAFSEAGAARVLLLLAASKGPVRTADLTERTRIARSAVRNAVLLLERCGLVARSIGPSEKGVDSWLHLRCDAGTRDLVALLTGVAQVNRIARIRAGRSALPPLARPLRNCSTFSALLARLPLADDGARRRRSPRHRCRRTRRRTRRSAAFRPHDAPLSRPFVSDPQR